MLYLDLSLLQCCTIAWVGSRPVNAVSLPKTIFQIMLLTCMAFTEHRVDNHHTLLLYTRISFAD